MAEIGETASFQIEGVSRSWNDDDALQYYQAWQRHEYVGHVVLHGEQGRGIVFTSGGHDGTAYAERFMIEQAMSHRLAEDGVEPDAVYYHGQLQLAPGLEYLSRAERVARQRLVARVTGIQN